MFEWAYSGVNSSLPGNGGPECAAFISPTRRVIETAIALAFASTLLKWGYKNISLPADYKQVYPESTGKRILLVLVCLMWGIEIGFKFASKSVIYLFNPCHLITAVQIYLLAAGPSKQATAMFRIHLNFLNGAVLAFVFPVTASRVLPFETSLYWIQHTMMMVVPYYLLRLGGAYNIERLTDMSWSALSYGLNLLYHFIVLQVFAIPTQVNLNHMLCPTPMDPFYGPYYRSMAMIHQALLCPLTSKLFCILCSFFITKFGPTKVKEHLEYDLIKTTNHIDNYKCSTDKMPTTDISEKDTHTFETLEGDHPNKVKNGHPHRD